MFLSLKVGGIATDTFLYVLIAVEHSINWFYVYRIMKLKKNPNSGNKEKLHNEIFALILGESLEIIIPIAYLICFVIAYFGPNAEILGNVRNDYWQFKSVDDIVIPIQNLNY